MWSPRTWLFYVFAKLSFMYTTISTTSMCQKTNTSRTDTNKYTAQSIAIRKISTYRYCKKYDGMLKVTQFCNQRTYNTLTLDVMAKCLWQLVKQNGE
uniref:Putative secreted protein n=1 Tax=Rhipicephalus microplus TaxID=6941 RepID=A0A6G5A103_RHIMP